MGSVHLSSKRYKILDILNQRTKNKTMREINTILRKVVINDWWKSYYERGMKNKAIKFLTH
jgi:predicted RNA binding protein with dsRBD fold (UPF0201 family)